VGPQEVAGVQKFVSRRMRSFCNDRDISISRITQMRALDVLLRATLLTDGNIMLVVITSIMISLRDANERTSTVPVGIRIGFAQNIVRS
jgi:hypothetical protein